MMNDSKKTDKYPYTIMDQLLNRLRPENIHEIKARQDIEEAILALFTQLVRDEKDYKTKIGKTFIDISKKRLQ